MANFKTIEDIIKFCESEHFRLWNSDNNKGDREFNLGKLCAYEIILDNLIDGFSKDGFNYTTINY